MQRAKSFHTICASRLYVPDSKRTRQVSKSDRTRVNPFPVLFSSEENRVLCASLTFP